MRRLDAGGPCGRLTPRARALLANAFRVGHDRRRNQINVC